METDGPCIALVPARDFRTGKSRLAPALTPEERDGLGRWMLERVLASLGEAPSVTETAVLSDADEILAIAEEHGAHGRRCPARDMNADLEAGRAWAAARGAASLLVVPADLPALDGAQVEEMIRRGGPNRAVLAPSGDGGTNGLLLRPPGAFPFAFGPGSYARHTAAAAAAGLEAVRFESPGFRLDVDTPADLAACREAGLSVPARP
ncbi:MAG: 2-phospho-L-lactate guanylyltransferase [bacterium]